MNVLACIIGVLSLFAVGYAGKVGECRTECAEQNSYKIVRVHLRETNVSAGLCQNTSKGNAKVVEFICNLKVGVWLPDIEAEEPFSFFPTSCPPVVIVDESEIATCPNSESEVLNKQSNSTISAVPEATTESNNATTITKSSSTTEAVPTPLPKKVNENSVTEPVKSA